MSTTDQSSLHGSFTAHERPQESNQTEIHKGRCYCHAVSWSIPAHAVKFTSLCHCKDCQIIGGSVLGQTTFIVYEPKKMEVEGQENVKVYRGRSDEGNETQRCFCQICGSVLWNRINEGKEDEHYAIRTGGLIDEEPPEVKKEIFMKSKPQWMKPVVQNEKNRFEAMPPS